MKNTSITKVSSMKTLRNTAIATFLTALVLSPVVVLAATAPSLETNPVGGLPTGTGVNEATGLIGVISTVVRFLLGFLGVVIFLLFLWAGVQYATAGGDEGKTQTATKTMINAVIGLIIVFIAFAASNAILGFVFQGANN
jgi:hypothetical protein